MTIAMLSHDMEEKLVPVARRFVRSAVPYTFTPLEARALAPFFTNTGRRVFFFRPALPASVSSALLAMYSRLKNPRGIRGHFVDNLLPFLLAGMLPKFADVAVDAPWLQAYLKENGFTTLDRFVGASLTHRQVFREFLDQFCSDAAYLKRIADSPKIRGFLQMYLDAYGHNSIARTATLTFCAEGVSLLAAKSLEWGRPGAGYVELSSRYVDFSQSPAYPIHEEIGVGWGSELADLVLDSIMSLIGDYRSLVGNSFDGALPAFLRELFAPYVNAKELASAVIGETCDVAGNLLPCATLTSLGVSVSGEQFPELLMHLRLDGTPENFALAELILEEAEQVGGAHFARHLEISPWRRAGWRYLDHKRFEPCCHMLFRELTEQVLLGTLNAGDDVQKVPFGDPIVEQCGGERDPRDKLPSQFELVSATFMDVMSFRSWRDLQRHGFCTHLRTLVTPELGFYEYDKQAPSILNEVFARASRKNAALYAAMRQASVPDVLCQYPMAMGNHVGFLIGANLRQWEFLTWQRTKFSVNHEVRQVVLNVERALRGEYPWWRHISRADMTGSYLCARTGCGIPT